MKLCFLVPVLFFSVNTCQSQDFSSISKKIENKCVKVTASLSEETYHTIRQKLFEVGKLSFLKSTTDTIFLLESYEIETGKYNGAIWTRGGKVEYSYYQKQFDFSVLKHYTDYTVRLVANWDIAGIREEERKYKIKLPEQPINATRVIIQGKKVRIDCFVFSEFFNLNRDR